MRVTFLTPHINISGGVKIVLGYADRLAGRGYRVTVICPQPIYPKRLLMNLLKYKPDWTEVAAEIKYVPSYDEKYIPEADIVVATAWQTAPCVQDYSSRKGRKFYFIQHYESLYHGDKKKVDETYLYPIKKIVVSNWLKEILKEKFNADSELIVNPIDSSVFYPTRKTYNENKRICMLYHSLNWKGIPDGIKAFEMAQQEHPETQLVMFGARNRDVDIDCEYHCRPSSDELRGIYNSCDIFLCPSWREGFGLPSAEAMACKCALVTTDNGGCRDYAIHGKTALVSPPKNPELLAENLVRLLSDEDLLRQIAQNGYEHIKQFTWDEAVSKMEKIFLEELGTK